MNNPQDPAQTPEGQGDMVTITMPTQVLDALIEILTAAKQKAQSDIGETGENDLSQLGEELSGSGRQPMQTVQR